MRVRSVDGGPSRAVPTPRHGRWTRASLGLLAIAILPVGSRALAAPPSKVADAPYPADFRARLHKAIQKGLAEVLTDTVLDEPHSKADETEYRVDVVAASEIAWTLRRAGLESDPAHAKAVKVLGTHPP